ncbi:VOC family protein [Mesorhizobium sp. AR10]|uniref:VOC family protein n=1 Tax=Mesorhizobium sp. AR10 TaxID=2865839 RepID=UPI00215F798D|nr:VOC family protein [Mesorhizobium sp. AR10]UVK37378.1 VOC family protein [Mesorhizobium sp. AR10]
MLHHVEIYVSDLDVTFEFWSKILARLGYRETAFWGEGFTLSNDRDAYLTFVKVSKKHESHRYHRSGVGLNHLAFKVPGRTLVDELRQFCVENGVPLLYDDRYPFANGDQNYYALYIEDPDRIKVEFVAAD